MADSVQLTDLDVITRYSIAVRTASADRDELIETLRSDLEWLERSGRRARPAPVLDAEPGYDDVDEVEPEPERPRPPLRRMPAKVSSPRATPAKRTPTKKTAAKKTAARRTR